MRGELMCPHRHLRRWGPPAYLAVVVPVLVTAPVLVAVPVVVAVPALFAVPVVAPVVLPLPAVPALPLPVAPRAAVPALVPPPVTAPMGWLAVARPRVRHAHSRRGRRGRFGEGRCRPKHAQAAQCRR